MRTKKETPQAVKILRLARDIRERPHTVWELSIKYEVSVRTVYRYLDYIKAAGLGLEQDFHKKYFIYEAD